MMEKYFFVDQAGQQRGPIDVEQFLEYGVKVDTLIWKDGMAGWVEAGKVPEVLSIFTQSRAAVPPPPPHYAVGSSAPVPPVAKPDNLMVWSILATVLCCLPLGIVAIVYSNKVDNLWYAKDYAGAVQAAKNAKTFCLIALGGGFVFSIIYIFIMIAASGM